MQEIHENSSANNSLMLAHLTELESEVLELRTERTELNKQISENNRTHEKLANDFENYQSKNNEKVENLLELIQQQTKQISHLKNYVKVAEDKSKSYEQEIFEANEKINRLTKELVEKQNFINNYLKKL